MHKTFEKTEKKYGSYWQFHWDKARGQNPCVLISPTLIFHGQTKKNMRLGRLELENKNRLIKKLRDEK